MSSGGGGGKKGAWALLLAGKLPLQVAIFTINIFNGMKNETWYLGIILIEIGVSF